MHQKWSKALWYLRMVKKNEKFICFVPRKMRKYVLQLYDVSWELRGSRYLQSIPYRERTAEMCEIAVKANSEAIRDVPKELLTKKLCFIAVEKNGDNLKYIPKEFRTKLVCYIAVKSYALALEYVPKEILFS